MAQVGKLKYFQLTAMRIVPKAFPNGIKKFKISQIRSPTPKMGILIATCSLLRIKLHHSAKTLLTQTPTPTVEYCSQTSLQVVCERFFKTKE